jgi:putative ABC transport system substrate-binding protein
LLQTPRHESKLPGWALTNPGNPNSGPEVRDPQDAAGALGRQVQVLQASSERDIDRAFSALAQLRPAALIITTDPFFTSQRHQIVTLANHHGLPTIYYIREWVVTGGLMSYGPSFADAYRQVGDYAAKILNGAKPSELPVIQSTKFELFINLKTAKTYGFAIPQTLLALADEVIE